MTTSKKKVKLFFLILNRMSSAVKKPHSLWVYRIVTDSGAAPHISDGYLTLTLCKPVIRKNAKVGDYVLALVAQSHKNIVGKGEDRFFKAAYLFRIVEKVQMKDYESWCIQTAPGKIPKEPDFLGNCQYGPDLQWRPGPHGPHEEERNLSGCFSLTTDTFAAWKIESPYTLTDEDILGIGLDKDQVRRATQGQFKLALTKEEQYQTLDKLISKYFESTRSNKKVATKHCKSKKGGTRKLKKERR